MFSLNNEFFYVSFDELLSWSYLLNGERELSCSTLREIVFCLFCSISITYFSLSWRIHRDYQRAHEKWNYSLFYIFYAYGTITMIFSVKFVFHLRFLNTSVYEFSALFRSNGNRILMNVTNSKFWQLLFSHLVTTAFLSWNSKIPGNLKLNLFKICMFGFFESTKIVHMNVIYRMYCGFIENVLLWSK